MHSFQERIKDILDPMNNYMAITVNIPMRDSPAVDGMVTITESGMISYSKIGR